MWEIKLCHTLSEQELWAVGVGGGGRWGCQPLSQQRSQLSQKSQLLGSLTMTPLFGVELLGKP